MTHFGAVILDWTFVGHGVQKMKNKASKKFKKYIFKAAIKTYLLDQKKHIHFSCVLCSVLALLYNFQIFWSLNLPVLQSSPLVPWSLGPLVPWSSGPLVLWYSGPLVLPSFGGSGALKHFEDNPYFNQP